jgi:hypothetical protein
METLKTICYGVSTGSSLFIMIAVVLSKKFKEIKTPDNLLWVGLFINCISFAILIWIGIGGF